MNLQKINRSVDSSKELSHIAALNSSDSAVTCKELYGQSDAELNSDGLMRVVKDLTHLYEHEVISESEFKGLLQLTVSEFVEQEVERKVSDLLSNRLLSKRFLNIIT